MTFRHRNGKTYELLPIKGKYHLVVALDSLAEVEAFRERHADIVFGARLTPAGEDKKNVVPFDKLTEE